MPKAREMMLRGMREALIVGSVTVLAACNAQAEPPRIVEVRAAAPGVVSVVFESGPAAAERLASPDTKASGYHIDGKAPTKVHRSSAAHDELPREGSVLPLVVRHYVYLDSGAPFTEGRTYPVTTPYGATELAFSTQKTRCEAIKVNQVGYSSRTTERYANFGVYLGDGESRKYEKLPEYSIIEERTGKVVFSGVGKYMGHDDEGDVSSGEHVYRLDLSSVPEGGEYFVTVEGCGRSPGFGVGPSYSELLARVAARALYHQRCGIALEAKHTTFTRAKCHPTVARIRSKSDRWIEVPDGAPQTPIVGGYHDAGDFDRRPHHLIIPILLLGYFEAFPAQFVDAQYDIPESGNGIPDFLDEALFALEVWKQLQVVDSKDPEVGGVMGGTEADRHPDYGVHSAANDPFVYGTYAVSEEATAYSAGFFAQASRLLRPFDEARANDLLERAQLAFRYLEKHAKIHEAKTYFMYSALQLYLATNDEGHHERFKKAARSVVLGTSWPEQFVPGNIAATCQTAHFSSYFVMAQAGESELRLALEKKVIEAADRGGYHQSTPLEEPYPQGVTKSLGWGAATAQGRYADVKIFAYWLSTDPAEKQHYLNEISAMADFALGLNPLGKSFVTGLGDDLVNSVTHLDSYFTRFGRSDGVTHDHVGKPIGNVPGIPIYGPTTGRSGQAYQRVVSDAVYPEWEDLPGLRRYADGWSLIDSNEFSTWETIVWNVVLHGFLHDAGAQASAPSKAKSRLNAEVPPPPPAVKPTATSRGCGSCSSRPAGGSAVWHFLGGSLLFWLAQRRRGARRTATVTSFR